MNKLNLLIPVYNGGEYFRECLDSIAKHIHIFDYIIISINKSCTQNNDINICNTFIDNNKDGKFKIIIQDKELSAIRHGRKILAYIKNDIELQNSFLMQLCHDDILLPDFSDAIQPLLPKLQENDTVNPARTRYVEHFTDAGKLYTYFGLSLYPDGISRDEFLHLDRDRGFVMGVSGIILHVNNYVRLSSLMRFLQFGWQAEYFFLASKNITRIYGTAAPLVGIRMHNNQQSNIVKSWQIAWDNEIYYFYGYFTSSCPILKHKYFRKSFTAKLMKRPVTTLLRLLYRNTVKRCISADNHVKFKGYVKKWLKK